MGCNCEICKEHRESEAPTPQASSEALCYDADHEIIFLLDDGSEISWCNDPAPGIGMEDADAVPYVRLDKVTHMLNEAINRPKGTVPHCVSDFFENMRKWMFAS